jgi:hypothetical protein
MKFILEIESGCEDAARHEAKQLTGKKLSVSKEIWSFSPKDPIDACKLCYCSKFIKKVLLPIKEEQKAEFDVKVIRQIADKWYVDFSSPGKNKIFQKDNPPNLGYSAACFAANEAGLKKDETIVDPLCRGGKLLIAAAHLLNNTNPGKFVRFDFIDFKMFKDADFTKLFAEWNTGKADKLKLFGIDSYTGNIENSRENLKYAGVDAELSARSIDWLDYVFEKESIDKIITMLPAGKHASTEALYRELFYQADYCLNKNGLMVVLSGNAEFVKKYAEQLGLVVSEKKQLNKDWIVKIHKNKN